jgi:hypothetical protein
MPNTQRQFYIKFSGSAFGLTADSPEQAWEQIRKNLDVLCTPNILEIGKDVDELGWPIRKDQATA